MSDYTKITIGCAVSGAASNITDLYDSFNNVAKIGQNATNGRLAPEQELDPAHHQVDSSIQKFMGYDKTRMSPEEKMTCAAASIIGNIGTGIALPGAMAIKLLKIGSTTAKIGGIAFGTAGAVNLGNAGLELTQ